MQQQLVRRFRKAGKREGNQPLLLLRFHVFFVLVFTVLGSLIGKLGVDAEIKGLGSTWV